MIYQWQIAALSQWTGIVPLTVTRWYRGETVRQATHVVLLDAVREHNFPSPPHLRRHRPTDIMKRLKAK